MSTRVGEAKQCVSMRVGEAKRCDEDSPSVPLPADKLSKLYTKSEAVNVVTRQTLKGSTERTQLVELIARKGYVPSKSALEKLMTQYYKDGAIHDDEWGRRGHKKRKTSAPSEDKSTKEQTETTSTKIDDDFAFGKLLLEVTPMRVRNISYDTKERIEKPKMIDICNYIGIKKLAWGQWGGYSRLYFSPVTFPPPTDLSKGGEGATFKKLKQYIELRAEQSGSPVMCNGSSTKEKIDKVFKCKHKYRGKGTAPKLSSKAKKKAALIVADVCEACPFRFLLRWDEFGYFIHLNKSDDASNTFGHPIHTCGMVKKSSSEDAEKKLKDAYSFSDYCVRELDVCEEDLKQLRKTVRCLRRQNQIQSLQIRRYRELHGPLPERMGRFEPIEPPEQSTAEHFRYMCKYCNSALFITDKDCNDHERCCPKKQVVEQMKEELLERQDLHGKLPEKSYHWCQICNRRLYTSEELMAHEHCCRHSTERQRKLMDG